MYRIDWYIDLSDPDTFMGSSLRDGRIKEVIDYAWEHANGFEFIIEDELAH